MADNIMNDIIDIDDLECEVAPAGAVGSVVIEIIFTTIFR